MAMTTMDPRARPRVNMHPMAKARTTINSMAMAMHRMGDGRMAMDRWPISKMVWTLATVQGTGTGQDQAHPQPLMVARGHLLPAVAKEQARPTGKQRGQIPMLLDHSSDHLNGQPGDFAEKRQAGRGREKYLWYQCMDRLADPSSHL